MAMKVDILWFSSATSREFDEGFWSTFIFQQKISKWIWLWLVVHFKLMKLTANS
jgi:hypothetical protein